MPLPIGVGELVVVAVVAIMTVALPIAILVALVRAARRPATDLRKTPDEGSDPRAALAMRLNRGEITREEFDVAMRGLGYEAQPSGDGESLNRA